MNGFDGLNYYEVLQIPVGASFIEIKRAYKEALSIYSEDSLATYCLFSDEERESILTIIEKAFLTLIDKDKRADYDRSLLESGHTGELVTANQLTPTMPSSHAAAVLNSDDLIGSISDECSRVRSAYRQELIQTIDAYSQKIKSQRINRLAIKNLHQLKKMREKVNDNGNLYEIEQQLLTISEDIEDPSLLIRRKVSTVIISYTLVAFISYMLLNITDAIMLHGFNIPYTVLLMGMVGCMVRMYLQFPNLGSRPTLSHNPIAWFIISPPIAVIMAGLFYGIAVIFQSLIQVDLYDETWLLWVLAWVVGLINWVNLFSRKSGSLRLRQV
jgi:curved DNA-binding protein CbpA